MYFVIIGLSNDLSPIRCQAITGPILIDCQLTPQKHAMKLVLIYEKISLTPLPLVPHICISELGKHWFR